MTKRLADLEKRQKALEQQKTAAPTANPVDAMAADLPYKAAVKAKPPENDDICIKGICVYGNFDMGLTYNQHGNPNTAFENPNYLIEKAGNGSYFGVGNNAMSASFIGLRGKQEIGDNLYAVFNLQTIFEPMSGMNMSGGGALVANNGLAISQWNAAGDTSKNGQMFNNAAYFGVSSPTYGTFTMGRQSALSSDLVVNYDPISGAGAFSAIAFEGAAGGAGDTQERIWDNSYEYRLNVGPVRLAAEIQLRNGGNSTPGNAFEGNIGFDYMGLSMDFVGGKVTDALSLAGGPLSTSQATAVQAAVNAGAFSCSLGCVVGTVSDNTVFQVAARYTIGPWKLFGGYENVRYSNPNNPLNPGAFMQGGYNIGVVNNGFYQTDKTLQIFWVGAKYAVTPTLDLMAAYYGYRAGSFNYATVPAGQLTGNGATVVTNGCNTSALAGCSGYLNMVSFVADWRFARHMDLYAGVAYSEKGGGLVNGYLLSNGNTVNKISTYDPTVGLRYQF